MDDKGRDQRTSQEIRRDIEATRAELRETVDALERKLSVGQIVDEVLGKVSGGHGARKAAATVGGAIREHPVPAGLIGLGAAWLAMDMVRGSDRDTNNTHLSGDSAEDSTGAAKKMTSTLADKATGVASGAKDKLASGQSAVGHAAERARDAAAEGMNKGKRGIESLMDEQPLALGAVAFGLGLASGLMVPASRWENETMGEAAESVKDEASTMAKEAVEGAKGIAADAASEAIGTVQEKVRAQDPGSDGAQRRAQDQDADGVRRRAQNQNADVVRRRAQDQDSDGVRRRARGSFSMEERAQQQ